MVLSIGFIICDILSVTHVIPSGALPDGINPFWKLAFIFKCLTDTIILDDFKTALDRLRHFKLEQMSGAHALELADSRAISDSQNRGNSVIKPAKAHNTEAEHLDFCTVPDDIYRNEAAARHNIVA